MLREEFVKNLPIDQQRCRQWVETLDVSLTESPFGLSDAPSYMSSADALTLQPLISMEMLPAEFRSPGPFSPPSISIPMWSSAQTAQEKHLVVYHVLCQKGSNKWEALRRFSGFVELDRLLAHQHRLLQFLRLRNGLLDMHAPPTPLPALPPRRYFFRTNRDVVAINSRCQALHHYLQRLLAHPQIALMSPIISSFLSDSSNLQHIPPLKLLSTTAWAVPSAPPPKTLTSAVPDPPVRVDPSQDPPRHPAIHIGYPAWIAMSPLWVTEHHSDGEKMALCIDLSRRNVLHHTGGPFGAAVFHKLTSRVLSVGISLVGGTANCCLHAEMVALQMATVALGSSSLAHEGQSPYELFASSEPCAMCIGAILWSGVGRLVCAATDIDVRALMHDTGPVFEDSFKYLRARGIEIERKFMRAEAKQVISDYVADHASAGRQV